MLDEEKDASAESEDALSDMELAMLIATASALLSAFSSLALSFV